MKAITEIEDPRLVKALSHPVRIRIIGILERNPATPKQMSTELGIALENIAYHVRALRRFGLIILDHERVVGSTVEHVYRTTGRPRITAEVWQQLPRIVKEALDSAMLDRIFDAIVRAAEQDKLTRAESHIMHRGFKLDRQGFSDASALLTDTLQQLIAIEEDAARRNTGHDDEIPTTLIALLFDTPEPTPTLPPPGMGTSAPS